MERNPWGIIFAKRISNFKKRYGKHTHFTNIYLYHWQIFENLFIFIHTLQWALHLRYIVCSTHRIVMWFVFLFFLSAIFMTFLSVFAEWQSVYPFGIWWFLAFLDVGWVWFYFLHGQVMDLEFVEFVGRGRLITLCHKFVSVSIFALEKLLKKLSCIFQYLQVFQCNVVEFKD